MFADNEDLSVCLTVSREIERDVMFNILGVERVLVDQQAFGKGTTKESLPGQKSVINVFEDQGALITLEYNGFMGISRSVVSKLFTLTGEEGGHYVSVYHSSGNQGWFKYVEIWDDKVLANFNPLVDKIPEAVEDVFPTGRHVTLNDLIGAMEYRIEIEAKPSWLTDETDTYLIDYRTPHHQSWKNTRAFRAARVEA